MRTRRTALRIAVCLATILVVGLFAREVSAQLINISTRGIVGTADNVMIAGFIIGGTTSKPVVIRGRGPSMGVAPFFVPGVLADPFLQVFSGQTLVAQNDNWQEAQQTEILLTGLDPCQPNPGQFTSPPGCTLEAAIVVTLPPGAYTVILGGVGSSTGVGLVEVFELTGTIPPPNILGTYTGIISGSQFNCQDPINNFTSDTFITVSMTGQNGSLFSGSAVFTDFDTVNVAFIGTVTGGGSLGGSWTSIATPSGFRSSGTFTGSLIGNTITIIYSGQITVGDTCLVSGIVSANR